MKTKLLTTLVAAGVMAAAWAVPVQAETAAQTQNLFENAGKKQTNKDFKPAPDKIKTSFGTLKFDLEAYPSEETTKKIYDEMDLQRATQAYMDFMPALSVYGKRQVAGGTRPDSADADPQADREAGRHRSGPEGCGQPYCRKS